MVIVSSTMLCLYREILKSRKASNSWYQIWMSLTLRHLFNRSRNKEGIASCYCLCDFSGRLPARPRPEHNRLGTSPSLDSRPAGMPPGHPLVLISLICPLTDLRFTFSPSPYYVSYLLKLCIHLNFNRCCRSRYFFFNILNHKCVCIKK